MSVLSPESVMEVGDVGRALHDLMRDLYPICRSVTGDGVRHTLNRIRREIPLELHEVPTGTRVFDWTVPREWNIRDAYVKDSRGERVIDFQKSNLHVAGYSVPVHRRLGFEELRTHLFTLPEQPDRIPFRTALYQESWGFCLTHERLEAMQADPTREYEVCIDSTLEDGYLTYGECFLPGEVPDEVLFSVHCCHPSLCNDNLSGIVVAVRLAQHLAALNARRYSYRFVFAPTTIGSITWLAQNESSVGRIRHGLVLTCLGDPGHLTYKKSRRGDAEIDRVVAQCLKHSGQDYELLDFSPYGYDERQYCSPGFNLPVGCLMRTPNGRFPEYHTSADDLEFVKPWALAESFAHCAHIVDTLERNRRYMNLSPKGEPQLGKRGLYRTGGGAGAPAEELLDLLWALNFSDGSHTLLDIAERANRSFEDIKRAANALVRENLLVESADVGRIG